jgi:hypothetical protein
VGAGDQLVQADPVDERRPWVDQGHGDVVALRQAVGGHHTGVAATDDDDLCGH